MTEKTTTKLIRIEDKIDSINEHLARINGSVANVKSWTVDHDKATATRAECSAGRWGKQNIINVILGVAGAACIVGLIEILIRKSYGG